MWMGSPRIARLLDRLVAAESWEDMVTILERDPVLLTPAVDGDLIKMQDAARRDGNEERLGLLTDIGELLAMSRRVGPRAAMAALGAEPDSNEEQSPALQFWALYRKTSEQGYLEAAVERWERDLTNVLAGTPDRVVALNNVSVGRVARFAVSGDTADLDRAVECAEEALALTPRGPKEWVTRASNLAGNLLRRFGHEADLDDVNRAVEVLQDAVASAVPGSPERALCLTNLASGLTARHRHTHQRTDLDAAVDAAVEAVQATPTGTLDYRERQDVLGTALEARFRAGGVPADLDAAIAAWRAAIRLGPRGGVVQVDMLFALGCAVRTRWTKGHDAADRDIAAEALGWAYVFGRDDARPLLGALNKAAISGAPVERVEQLPPDLTTVVGRIAAQMKIYETTDDPTALDRALRGYDLLLSHPALAPERAPLRAGVANDAGYCRWLRLGESGADADLDAAITLYEEALALTAPGDPHAAARHENLGVALLNRSRRADDADGLAHAIDELEQAVAARSPEDHLLPSTEANLAEALLARHEATSDESDLTRSLELLQPAVAALPDGSSERAAAYGALSRALLARHELARQPADLDAAIAHLREVSASLLRGVPLRAQMLSALGGALIRRFLENGSAADLQTAVAAFEQTVDETAPGSSLRAEALERLVGARVVLAGQTGTTSESERAVEEARALVDDESGHGAARGERLCLLGVAMTRHARLTGRAEDLAEAVATLRRAAEHGVGMARKELATALMASYETHHRGEDLDAAIAEAETLPGEDLAATVLGQALFSRYGRDHRREDLDRALEIFERTAGEDEVPAGRVWALNDLGRGLSARHALTDDPHDRERAVAAFREAAQLGLDSNPRGAVGAAQNWGRWARDRRAWDEAAEAYRLGLEALDLLVKSAPLRDDKTALLGQARGLAADAAFAFVFAGRSGDAVVALEQNRALLLSEVLQREGFDLARLREEGHQEPADRYASAVERIARLEQSELQRNDADRLGPARSHPADAARWARTRLDDAITEIQALPGQDGFLNPPAYGDIQAMAAGNPLIYLTAGAHWGSALVVGEAVLPAILLPALTEQALRDHLREYLDAYGRRRERPDEWRSALVRSGAWLWQAIIGPVLEVAAGDFGAVFGLAAAGTQAPPPAVLIPVGPLGLLPLQVAWTPDAARPAGRRYALDALQVTYTPNARALAEAKRVAAATGADRFLAVEEPSSSSADPLPCALAEVLRAGSHFSTATPLRDRDANPTRLLELMPEYDVLHFACHAQADPDEPLDSFLLLADDERLLLRDLLSKRNLKARLAVLSACETAVVGRDLPDEVVGLATGLLQAGVAGVIGSMWAVPDASTALLLARFYELWRDDANLVAPAEALRRAQCWLRDTTNGEKLELFPEMLEATAARVPASGRQLWKRGHGHRHPYHWAGFAYLGA